MEEINAIVLKNNFTNGNKLCLLDRHDGVFWASLLRVHSCRCCCGALVTCTVQQRGHSLLVHDVLLCSVPTIVHVSALRFFHQVLEICLYSVPQGAGAEDIFDLLMTLYARGNELFDASRKATVAQKIFLCKLFGLVGILPDDKKFQKWYFERVIFESIDSLLSGPIKLEYESDLDNWIGACFAVHPYRKSFKTIHGV